MERILYSCIKFCIHFSFFCFHYMNYRLIMCWVLHFPFKQSKIEQITNRGPFNSASSSPLSWDRNKVWDRKMWDFCEHRLTSHPFRRRAARALTGIRCYITSKKSCVVGSANDKTVWDTPSLQEFTSCAWKIFWSTSREQFSRNTVGDEGI